MRQRLSLLCLPNRLTIDLFKEKTPFTFRSSCWSHLVASKNPRLLLDQSITEPLASYIIDLVPSAKRSSQSFGQAAKEGEIAALANEDRQSISSLPLKHHYL